MKRYAILLAALLLLALCAGCGRQAAEPETLADYMAALTADDVADWNTEQYPDITLGRLVAAMNRAAAHQIPQAEAVAAGDSADKQSWSVFFTDADGRSVMLTCNDAAADIVQLSVLDAANNRAFTDGKNAFFQDETLYGLVRHAQDSLKTLDDEDSVQHVLQMIGWPEKAELTTKTFTFDYLKVQVTNVYQTGKGVAQEDENQTYEYDIYIVAPGATLTVLESAYIEDCEGETHAGWHYYTPEDGAWIGLWPDDTRPIEDGSFVGQSGVGVLSFRVLDGWLQAPSDDPVASVYAAITAEGQRDSVRSVRVDSVTRNEAETKQAAKDYADSGELAVITGWASDPLVNHVAVMDAAYWIEYDPTLTSLEGGDITQRFYLAQDFDGRWIIVDAAERTAAAQEGGTAG